VVLPQRYTSYLSDNHLFYPIGTLLPLGMVPPLFKEVAMSAYDINVTRIRACAQSNVGFIELVSEIETVLLTIRALNICGIPDDIDQDGRPGRTCQIVWMAEELGYSCELKLISDYLKQKYVTELILLANEIDEAAWDYGFRTGVKKAQDELSEQEEFEQDFEAALAEWQEFLNGEEHSRAIANGW
jgi:hypothetical protein